LAKEKYNVPQGGVVIANMNVKIPEEASIGQTYNVVYKFSQVADEGDLSGVTFSQSFESHFDVNIVPEVPLETEPEGISMIWWILGIIAIIIIIIVVKFILKGKKGSTPAKEDKKEEPSK
jgi:hypothetical protein